MRTDHTEPTLEDRAELEIRERLTVLETKHNKLVDASRWTQVVAYGAILLALGILLVWRKVEAP